MEANQQIAKFIRQNWGIILAISIVAIYFVVFLLYQLHFHFPIPPGDDGISHIEVARRLYDNPGLLNQAGDEPGFHLVVAGIAHLTGADVVTVMDYAWLTLLPLSALTLFFLARRWFGTNAALIALLLYFIVSGQPLQTLNDGGFPNLLAAGTLLLIAYGCWVNFWAKLNWWSLAGFLATFSAVIFVHRLSTIIGSGVILASLIPLAILRLSDRSQRSRWWWLVIPIAILGLIGFGIVVARSPFFANGRELLSQFFVLRHRFPYIAFADTYHSSPIWHWRDYLQNYGAPILLGSVAGFVLLFISIWRLPRDYRYPVVFLLSWALAMFAGSRLSQLGEPGRLSRDLAIPAVIIAASGLALVARHFSIKGQVSVLLTFLLIFPYIGNRVHYFTTYNPAVRYSAADVEMKNYLATHTVNGLLIGPHNEGWTRIYPPTGTWQEVDNSTELGVALQSGQYHWIIVSQYQPKIWFPADPTILPNDLVASLGTLVKSEKDDTKELMLYHIRANP